MYTVYYNSSVNNMERTYRYNFETNENTTFNGIDFVVFGATLLASAAIGLFYAIRDRNNDDTEEFLLAGRKLHYLPVSLSLLSSFISAITLLGTPAEVYRYNTMYWWISIGFLITGLGSAHIFVPIFYNLKVTSTFQVCMSNVKVIYIIQLFILEVKVINAYRVFIQKVNVAST